MMTFLERLLWMEENIQLKITFDQRQPWMEDALLWKKTFEGRLNKDNFDGIQSSMGSRVE